MRVEQDNVGAEHSLQQASWNDTRAASQAFERMHNTLIYMVKT